MFGLRIIFGPPAAALVGDDQAIFPRQMLGERFKIGAVSRQSVHQQKRLTLATVDTGIEGQPVVRTSKEMIGIFHHACLGVDQNFTPAVTKTWRGLP